MYTLTPIQSKGFAIEMSAKWNRHFATNKLNYGRTYPLCLWCTYNSLLKYFLDRPMISESEQMEIRCFCLRHFKFYSISLFTWKLHICQHTFLSWITKRNCDALLKFNIDQLCSSNYFNIFIISICAFSISF